MPGFDTRNGSWAEYRRLIIQVLKDLEERQKSIESVHSDDRERMESLRKDVSAIKAVIFGDGDPDNNLQVRLARIEDFIRTHPTLYHPKDTDGGGGKVDKKMLVLLVGSVSGLVALAAKLVDLLRDLVTK